MNRSTVRLVVAAAGWIGFSPVALAQIGSGWKQYRPGSQIHLDGSDGIEASPGTSTNLRNEGASFKKAGGIETFAIFDPISNRSERRIRNDYTGGRWQFQGEVRVTSAEDQSVMQIFGGRTPATTQMIRAFNSGGGTLKKVPGSVTLATGTHGKWIRINVVHDVDANTVKTYVNGQLKATGDGEAPSKWYHKYGCYGTLKIPGAKVQWRNVKHFAHSSNTDIDSLALMEEPSADEDAPSISAVPADTSAVEEDTSAVADDAANDPAFGCAVGSGRPAGWSAVTLALAVAALSRRRRRTS